MKQNRNTVKIVCCALSSSSAAGAGRGPSLATAGVPACLSSRSLPAGGTLLAWQPPEHTNLRKEKPSSSRGWFSAGNATGSTGKSWASPGLIAAVVSQDPFMLPPGLGEAAWAAAGCVCHPRVRTRRNYPSALALGELIPMTIDSSKNKDIRVTAVVI